MNTRLMKNAERLSTLAVAIAVVTIAGQSHAQFRPTYDDGITASPHVRKNLDEQHASALAAKSATERVTGEKVAYRATGGDRITASPKGREFLDGQLASRRALEGGQVGGAPAGYHAPGEGGIAASPKVRQQMREHNAQPRAELAPISR
jgi:hypothetical protein